MAQILVTGAGGFIGAALVRRLRADGHDPVCLSGSGRQGPGEFRQFDLLEAGVADVARLTQETGVTHCIHAAWYTNHADYLVSDINHAWRDASLRLAAGFREGGGTRFVGLGTCLEYDQDADGGRFSEALTPLRPETLYARCKTALYERLAEAGGDFAWARIFFVYGPGDRAGRLVPSILAGLAKGERVGARFGGLRRDYIHVDDLAGQVARIALSDLTGAVNTGTGRAERIADIFTAAAEIAGRPNLVDVNDRTGGGQADLIEADMTRFEAEIGSPATRPIRDGLAELLR
ncbi:MAG: NAD-dependent epimerase/dehydratase family protein [Allosphingosinicella sp.]|uniref:NAD-dependent epimerase/dehydratase family protein n=1 Tax=Allosphingosinicella sp. TaxID=2823234 RepID=UPI003946E697